MNNPVSDIRIVDRRRSRKGGRGGWCIVPPWGDPMVVGPNHCTAQCIWSAKMTHLKKWIRLEMRKSRRDCVGLGETCRPWDQLQPIPRKLKHKSRASQMQLFSFVFFSPGTRYNLLYATRWYDHEMHLPAAHVIAIYKHHYGKTHSGQDTTHHEPDIPIH